MLPIHDENGRFPYYQIGVVSWGAVPCAKDGVPTIYTSTQYYVEWIQAQLE